MTDADRRTLTEAQLGVLTCPVEGCGRLLVRPLGNKKVEHGQGWVCRILGHTGLLSDTDVQDRFLAVTPHAIRQYDPQRADAMFKYAMKRGHECWQTPEALKRAEANARARKGRKR
jgi:hypothetical protein